MNISQYNQVADQLRQDILSGVHPSGARLPTERALCTQYAVSRITIRQALTVLEDEQLIVRRQGSGTYVRHNPSRRIPLMIDYTGSMRAHAPTLSRDLLVASTLPAPEWICDELRIPHDTEVYYAERVDRVGSTAVAWDRVYIRPDYATALTPHDLSRVDFLEAWCAAEAFRPACCRQRVNALPADAADEERLGIQSNTPLLRAIDIYEAAKGQPVGLFVSHYHPAYISITSRFDYTIPKEHS